MRISDWSSDVCSSDLQTRPRRNRRQRAEILFGVGGRPVNMHNLPPVILAAQEHGFGSDEIDRAVFVRAVRTSVVEGESVSEREDVGGGRSIKRKQSTRRLTSLTAPAYSRQV